MDPIQRALFSGFPRNMGVPKQFTVFSANHFDRVVQKANQRNTVYCSISQLYPRCPIGDKVFFDLDGKAPPSLAGMSEREQFAAMREDPDVADAVLGDVVEDMHTLARRSLDDGIPILGLYSGMGVHLHQLYQETVKPFDEIKSTGNMYTEELGLSTVDYQCFEPKRITKIPNTRRMEDGEFTGVWTIPLSAEEMTEATVNDLIEWSREPRSDLTLDATYHNRSIRPAMEVHDDYLGVQMTEAAAEEREMAESIDDESDAVEIVEEFIELPCIRERVLTRDPGHKIRWDFAVLMFNYGFSREEVHDIIRELGWKDYEPSKTAHQLNNIWSSKLGDMSCSALMSEQWCTRKDNPQSCPAYGWQGGNDAY